MKRADDEEINPYQAPRSSWEPQEQTQSNSDDANLLKRFRQQCVALGALWMITGVLAGTIGVSGITESRIVSVALAFGSVPCVALGLLVCLRRIWAVRITLWFGYAFVATLAGVVVSWGIADANLVPMAVGVTIMPGMVLFAGIAQAHRVIRWSNRLPTDGISLDER